MDQNRTGSRGGVGDGFRGYKRKVQEDDGDEEQYSAEMMFSQLGLLAPTSTEVLLEYSKSAKALKIAESLRN